MKKVLLILVLVLGFISCKNNEPIERLALKNVEKDDFYNLVQDALILMKEKYEEDFELKTMNITENIIKIPSYYYATKYYSTSRNEIYTLYLYPKSDPNFIFTVKNGPLETDYRTIVKKFKNGDFYYLYSDNKEYKQRTSPGSNSTFPYSSEENIRDYISIDSFILYEDYRKERTNYLLSQYYRKDLINLNLYKIELDFPEDENTNHFISGGGKILNPKEFIEKKSKDTILKIKIFVFENEFKDKENLKLNLLNTLTILKKDNYKDINIELQVLKKSFFNKIDINWFMFATNYLNHDVEGVMPIKINRELSNLRKKYDKGIYQLKTENDIKKLGDKK